MAPNNKSLTYRVRQLPLEISKAEVTATFQRHLWRDSAFPVIHVHSLARDLSSLHASRTKTATITIDPLPSHLTGRNEWDFWTTYRQSEHNIIVDLHFLDFTVLNEVRDKGHVLDCVAIGGLGGHAFGSWKRRDGSPFMWLRDGLPGDIPGVRSIIYGYDSQVHDSNSFQRPHDIAARLANRLRSVGFGSSQSKPLVLLAHSLGGIILKEVLITLAGISDQKHSVLGNLRLVVFFGVPHKGMSTKRLITMVKDRPNEDLVRDLSPGSSYLLHVEKRFNGVHTSRKFRVVSFYETKTSTSVQKNDNGTWSRTGPSVRMVDRESAIQQCSRDPEDVYSIDEDHSTMVKFSRDDANYRCVLDCLEKASPVIGADDAKYLRSDSYFSEDERHNWDSGDPVSAGPSATSATHGLIGDDARGSPEATISSLQLEVLNVRMAGISDPYQSTLDWIFDSDVSGFTTWLLKDQGVYWIKGKPGSGKSTFMKHVARHQYTEDFLSRWSHPAQLIKAGFFFYHRGSQIQKSFDGLVRSVLVQILQAVPDLCRCIPLKCFPKTQGREYDWSPANLQDALRSVLGQRRRLLKICFFIDALDEFDGHLEILAHFIETLIQGGCKVCFSSRPREILERYFGTCPGIDIHNHTKADIRRYTGGRLANLPGIRGPSGLSREMRDSVSQAVRHILRNANGVFLWVKLVLDRIEQEGFSAHGISTLLHEMPIELEDFYESTIKRIPQGFRWEAYLILDVMFRAREEPRLIHVFWIVQWVHCQTLKECFEKQGKHADFLRFCHLLKERCGGLVEISEPFIEDDHIRLIHETAREFIGGPRFQELAVGEEALFNAQNGNTELAKLFLVALKYSLDLKFTMDDMHRFDSVLRMCALYCNLAEATTGACQSQLIDGLQPHELKGNMRGGHLGLLYPASALEFAIDSGLLQYAQQSLRLMDTKALDSVIGPSLHSVIETVLDLEYRWTKPSDALFDAHRNDMTGIFLDAATRSSRNHGRPAFGYLLLRHARLVMSRAETRRLSLTDECQEAVLRDLAQVYLDHGQDPNMEMLGLPENPARICGNKKGPRPLHLASIKTAELLLNYGANINLTDRDGRTPLDMALRRLVLFKWYCERKDGHEILLINHIAMLMNRGACITRAGLKFFPFCDSTFRKYHCELETLLELGRNSVENGFISKFDIHVLPIVSQVSLSFLRLVSMSVLGKKEEETERFIFKTQY